MHSKVCSISIRHTSFSMICLTSACPDASCDLKPGHEPLLIQWCRLSFNMFEGSISLNDTLCVCCLFLICLDGYLNPVWILLNGAWSQLKSSDKIIWKIFGSWEVDFERLWHPNLVAYWTTDWVGLKGDKSQFIFEELSVRPTWFYSYNCFLYFLINMRLNIFMNGLQ